MRLIVSQRSSINVNAQVPTNFTKSHDPHRRKPDPISASWLTVRASETSQRRSHYIRRSTDSQHDLHYLFLNSCDCARMSSNQSSSNSDLLADSKGSSEDRLSTAVSQVLLEGRLLQNYKYFFDSSSLSTPDLSFSKHLESHSTATSPSVGRIRDRVEVTVPSSPDSAPITRRLSSASALTRRSRFTSWKSRNRPKGIAERQNGQPITPVCQSQSKKMTNSSGEKGGIQDNGELSPRNTLFESSGLSSRSSSSSQSMAVFKKPLIRSRQAQRDVRFGPQDKAQRGVIQEPMILGEESKTGSSNRFSAPFLDLDLSDDSSGSEGTSSLGRNSPELATLESLIRLRESRRHSRQESIETTASTLKCKTDTKWKDSFLSMESAEGSPVSDMMFPGGYPTSSLSDQLMSRRDFNQKPHEVTPQPTSLSPSFPSSTTQTCFLEESRPFIRTSIPSFSLAVDQSILDDFERATNVSLMSNGIKICHDDIIPSNSRTDEKETRVTSFEKRQCFGDRDEPDEQKRSNWHALLYENDSARVEENDEEETELLYADLAKLRLKHEALITDTPFLASKRANNQSGKPRSSYIPARSRFSTSSSLWSWKAAISEKSLALRAGGCASSLPNPGSSFVSRRSAIPRGRASRQHAYNPTPTFLTLYGSD
ncbi:hypothetical protein CROQUDRAFT_662088 [Cronartium quercuum f. sp. fusiforme G11]|uniref:Uncharacterized protein n=1 Tax=Cronartium quercuum f. sp. fusiforme G11 TaxID=708437 RepID=A0A9P6NBA2_9BASI|nr:hypothetical protein CROQUDRAFT_662088 [Cronartium quercuum f. sp. fusiforme G11]